MTLFAWMVDLKGFRYYGQDQKYYQKVEYDQELDGQAVFRHDSGTPVLLTHDPLVGFHAHSEPGGPGLSLQDIKTIIKED